MCVGDPHGIFNSKCLNYVWIYFIFHDTFEFPMASNLIRQMISQNLHIWARLKALWRHANCRGRRPGGCWKLSLENEIHPWGGNRSANDSAIWEGKSSSTEYSESPNCSNRFWRIKGCLRASFSLIGEMPPPQSTWRYSLAKGQHGGSHCPDTLVWKVWQFVLGSHGSLLCAKLSFKSYGLYEEDWHESNMLMQ